MHAINVQSRLMPDIVETANRHTPGIYYNLLVSSTDSNGNHVPASVRFRAAKALNDPSHSGNGTEWSKPIKTSMFGHVLWSINALTDALPPTIEAEVTQVAPKGKPAPKPVVIEVHPALNLIGFLQKLNQKTEAEWKTFLLKTNDNTAQAEFASAALFAGCDAVLKGLQASEPRVATLMAECYSDHSGIANFNLALGQKSENLFSTQSNIALDETKAFEALLKATAAQAQSAAIAGGVSAWFIQDVNQLMQLMKLLVENDQQKMRDLFQWIGLDLIWESIGDSYIMLKETLKAGLLMAKKVGHKSESEWINLIDGFQGLMKQTSPVVGNILSKALPVAKDVQQDWAETVPHLHGHISINHQQFELGWLSWRIMHSFPQSSSGANDLIGSILKSCDFDKFYKAFHDLMNALEGLDVSKEIEEDLTRLASFFSQVLQGDSTQVAEKLLKGGPELTAMEDLPNQVFKVINTIAIKGKAIPELITAIAEIVEAIFTTPIPMPFIEAIKPWFTPKQNAVTKSADESGICLMDCLILMLVIPSVKVYMDANGKLPPALKQLRDTETWMLDKIPIHQIIELVVKGYEAQHQVSDWALDHPPPMPIPGILSQLPFEEEVFDALILFLKIANGIREAIQSTVKLAFEAEEDAEAEAASLLGEEDVKDAANDVDWKPVIEKFADCCFESIDYSLKCNINLLGTAKLYLLNKEPKAKFAHVGQVDVVVFNPVYPEWVGLSRQFLDVASTWAKFTVEFILAINEDEEVAAGAADFEISGAAYTVSDDTMRKVLKWCYRLIPVFTFIPDTTLKLLSWTNAGLYYVSDIPDVRPLAKSAFSDLRRDYAEASHGENEVINDSVHTHHPSVHNTSTTKGSHSHHGSGPGPGSETQQHAVSLAKYADPTYNFTVTKIVLAIVGGIANKLTLAAPLIRKIPEEGPEMSYDFVSGCLLTVELCSGASLVIDCYQFHEKYQPNEQAKSAGEKVTNH